MKILVYCFFFFLLAFSCNAFGKQVCEIELIDGGVILGEIISHNNGTYVVQSNSLGTLKVKESEIRVIRFESHSSDGTKKKKLLMVLEKVSLPILNPFKSL